MATDSTTEQKRGRWSEDWHKWYKLPLWRPLRARVLARDPICKICNRKPANVADHIKPHRGVWALFVDMANLQGLCKECHDRKTASEDGGFGNCAQTHVPGAPVATGSEGKQFQSTSVGSTKLDKALDVDLSDLLDVDL